nr:MAG TPA: hypothetical protein [Caudoviricetes sp.]
MRISRCVGRVPLYQSCSKEIKKQYIRENRGKRYMTVTQGNGG